MPASSSHKVRSSAWRVFLLLRQKRITTVVLLFLILITSSLDIAVPFITQHLIDNIVQSVRNVGQFAINTLFLSLAAIFVSVAATRVLRSVYNYRLFQTMAGIEDKLKSAAFENYLRCDTALHTSTSSGEIIGALDRGATAIFVVLYEILGQNLVPPLIIFAGVFTSLLFKSPLIAFTVFLPLPLYLLIVGRSSESLQKQEQIVSREFELVSKECYDIAGNVATVKKFSQERREAALQRRLLANARVPQFLAERNWAASNRPDAYCHPRPGHGHRPWRILRTARPLHGRRVCTLYRIARYAIRPDGRSRDPAPEAAPQYGARRTSVRGL